MKSPFNEKKYRDLLKGLEASEVNYKDIAIDNEVFRYDAEYFRKESMQLLSMIRSGKFFLIENEFEVSKLAGFEFTEYFTEYNMNSTNNYIALTSKNVQNEKLNLGEYITIDKQVADNFLQRSKLLKNDIILSYTGEYRRSLVLLENGYQLGPNVCRLRPKTNNELSFYVSTFFNSKIGQIILDKEKTLSAQPTVAMSRIRKIPIPYFSRLSELKTIILHSNDKLKQSQSFYRQAEDLLSEAIGIKNFKPSKKGTNIKSFKESFLATGRLDAEYYQPKYEEMIAKIKKQPYDILGNLVNIKKSIEPGSDVYTDEGLPFIRVSDYNKFGISTPEKCLSICFCKENAALLQSLYPAKETILFSKDGSVGTAYMVRENMQAVTSGAILHLTVKDKTKVLPEYLALVLNSEAVKQQAERDSGGSIILHWRVNEIKNVFVPIVGYKTQQQIAGLIEKSFNLRQKSEELLEEAKGMVEREIGGK